MEDFSNVFHFGAKLLFDQVSFDISISDIIYKSIDNEPTLDKVRNQITVILTLIINGFEKAPEFKWYKINFGF